MTPDELKAALVELFGQRGWQVRAARALAADVSSVRRWVGGERPIPGPVKAAVECWLGHKTGTPPQ